MEPVYKSMPVISEAVRMSVDKMCYMAVYGCRTTLESKVPASARSQYQVFLSTMHKDAESEFVEAWKKWLIDHPDGFDKEDRDTLDVTDASFFNIYDSEEEGGDEAGEAGAGEAGAGEAGAARQPTPSTPPS